MKKTIREVFEAIEGFLGKKLSPANKAVLTEMFSAMGADEGSVPPPTAPPPGPKP